ncbi:efflux RND transporter permease subunit [Marinicellulosiphila megalodicopiae]|uniref:efflux RND transporter permease subunit n=1 Tax=Marinicellulosiphila megalodicopiae TaxID=2724896 RepID=UPI003BB0FDF2
MKSLIESFARHRIASNIVMFVIILGGLWSLNRINTQFLPDFELKLVNAVSVWSGANVEDMQSSIAEPAERAILAITEVDSVNTTVREGYANLNVTLKEYVDDVDQAMSDIQNAVDSISLPEGAEEFTVEQFTFFDPVANVILYGDLTLEELQILSEKTEKSLRNAGISKLDVSGLPEKQLNIELSIEQSLDRNQSAQQLGNLLRAQNSNTPAGQIESNNSTAPSIQTQLRFSEQSSEIQNLSDASISLNELKFNLTDLADLTYEFNNDEQTIFYKGQRAVILSLSRAKNEDTLEVADRLIQWEKDYTQTLPQSVNLKVYNENWKFVKSRISIIVNNGLGGMALVLIILFIFLNSRLAWWVAAGIPISFLGALIVMDFSGTSINMISLFGFLIALGIIVDDAIVVSEDTYAEIEKGATPEDAAVTAAHRMLPAIIASSITTIAAFLPLLLVGGQAGTFTKSVPLVVIFAIVASLIECFIILPGHLAHSLKAKKDKKENKYRKWINDKIDYVRENPYRKLVRLAINNRRALYVIIVSLFILSITMVTSGRVKFVFFPAIASPQIELEVEFSQDSPAYLLSDYLDKNEQIILNIEKESGVSFVQSVIKNVATGDAHSGSIFVELDSSTDRALSNDQILTKWRENLEFYPGLLSVKFKEGQQGPSTNSVSFRLSGDDLTELKAASNWLQNQMATLGTVVEITDNLPLGAEQIILSINSEGVAAGLTVQSLSQQINTITGTTTVQELQHLNDDLKVQIGYNNSFTHWQDIKNIPIQLNDGSYRPIGAFLDVQYSRAIEQLNRVDGELAVVVSAKRADRNVNLNEVNKYVTDTYIPQLLQQFNVNVNLEGDAAGQASFLVDVQFGALIGMFLIFGVLAWVFESYAWPVAVMAAIPLGLTGAIFGHYFMGLELSALSIYGLFGLSGIVINDSIVLVSYYKRLREEGVAIYQAIEEAAVRRFRPVVLTSMTTCGGLTPLLFESAFDAQFLIPMAAGLVFGLAYATILILLFVPALLVSIEKRRGVNKAELNKELNEALLAV